MRFDKNGKIILSKVSIKVRHEKPMDTLINLEDIFTQSKEDKKKGY